MMITAFQGIDPITRNFSYEGEALIDGVRYNKFMMLGTRYCDPVMDAYQVRVEFMKHGFWVNNWHASRYIEDYAGIRPDIYKKVKLLAGLRVFTVKNTFDIPSVGSRTLPAPGLLSAGSMAIIADVAQCASFPVKKNKGRHWIGKDALYIGPDVLVAEKLNGLHAQITINNNIATVISPFGGMNIGLPGRVDGSHYFEAELIFAPYWEDRVYNLPPGMTISQAMHKELLNVKEIVIFDGIPGGTSYCRSFIDRWEDITNFFVCNESFLKIFKLQNYITHPTAHDLQVLWDRSVEGIVLQPACSPAGCFGDGAGSARYFKKRITIEQDTIDGIVEVDVKTLRRVRRRPDRVIATNMAEIALIREYWSFDEFAIYYRAMRNLYDPKGHRFPVLRTIKEYAAAVEGTLLGYDAEEVVQDIFFAYMSYYSGYKCDVGAVSNVGDLIKAIDVVRKKEFAQEDFNRILQDKLASEYLIEEIANKTSLTNENCIACSKQLSKTARYVYIRTVEAYEMEKQEGYPDAYYYGLSGKTLVDLLTANYDLSNLTHWFFYGGETHRDGVILKYNRSLGELKKRTVGSGLGVRSYVESLEVFNVSIPYGVVTKGNKRGHLWAEFYTVNLTLEPRSLPGVWLRPMINKASFQSDKVRCLGDMIRYVAHVNNMTIVSGI
jgi:hypothetical protein